MTLLKLGIPTGGTHPQTLAYSGAHAATPTKLATDLYNPPLLPASPGLVFPIRGPMTPSWFHV